MADISRIFLLGAVLALTAACGSTNKRATERFAYVEEPVEILYQAGAEALSKRRYDDAIGYFAEVERQHPYSAWARRSMLMTAYTEYLTNDFEASLGSIERFLAIHPGNKDAGYAYYLRAMCFYERIRDVGRDQGITVEARDALIDVIRRYPDTEYARDAQLKLDLTRDHLAGKEMDIGRYYLRRNQHVAAIGRFNNVIEKYQTTGHVPEALHRSVEAYLELGLVDEARRHAAILGYNYPDSEWYDDTFRIFRRNFQGLIELQERNALLREEREELSPEERLERAGRNIGDIDDAPQALPPRDDDITPDLPGAPPESI
ncbi:MAG: outer membrane protein assembly factor BamD [Pseudomonadota bacterium]